MMLSRIVLKKAHKQTKMKIQYERMTSANFGKEILTGFLFTQHNTNNTIQ